MELSTFDQYIKILVRISPFIKRNEEFYLDRDIQVFLFNDELI